MTDDQVPDDIRELAEARRTARAERDWSEADRLKAEIETAGWKVVDRGASFTLGRAVPPDAREDGLVRYGSSGSVPSVLDEGAAVAITVVRAVPDHAASVGAVTSTADGAGGQSLQTVLVANRPAAGLPDGDPEVVLMNGWPGAATALNAGIRRARGRVVALVEPALAITTSQLTDLARALDDPTVAVAGPWGLISDDLRRFDLTTRAGEVTAIDGRLLLFRREDFIARGPLDEQFVDPHRLDVWWSLVLRDEGLEAEPRRALVVDVGMAAPSAAPVADSDRAGHDDEPASQGTPAQRRNFYRVIREFGGARHLART